MIGLLRQMLQCSSLYYLYRSLRVSHLPRQKRNHMFWSPAIWDEKFIRRIPSEGGSPRWPSNSFMLKTGVIYLCFFDILSSMTNAIIDNKNRKRIENFALMAGIAQPLITLPQIIAIYGNQSAEDVSLLTWVGYLIFGIIFLIYGIVFNLKPIWAGQIIWVTMQLITVTGILIYS
jgi:uncharacterized protein with PQ loop repeat